MSKFKVSDQTVTLSREYTVSREPIYNAQKLYNTLLDPNLSKTITVGSILYYDGSKWVLSTLPNPNSPIYNANKLYNTLIDPNLNLTPSGSVLYYDGSKWTYVPISSAPATAVYGTFISTNSQTVSSIHEPTTIYYDSNPIGNINIKNNTYPGTRVVIPTSGVYRVLFSAQCDSVSGNNHLIEIWPVINNTPVPDSNTRIVMNTGAESCLTVEYFLTFAANDELHLNMIGDSKNDCRLAYYPSRTSPLGVTIPAIPSIILNINKI